MYVIVLDSEPKFKVPKQCTQCKTSTKRVSERNYECIVSDTVLKQVHYNNRNYKSSNPQPTRRLTLN